MSGTIQLRRGSKSAAATSNPVLADGEAGYEKDTGRIKVGDGTTAWNSLPYVPFLYAAGAWQANTAYPKNSVVTNGGFAWRAAADVPSRTTFTSSDWESWGAAVAGSSVTSVDGSSGVVVLGTTYAALYNANPPQAGSLRQVGLRAAQVAVWTSAVQPAPQLKVLTLGDSYAGKVLLPMGQYLGLAFGPTQGGSIVGGVTSGTGFNGSGPTTNSSSTSPAPVDNLTDFDAWFSGYTTTFSAGASRTYGAGGVGATADELKLYYIIEDAANSLGGGTFKVQVDGTDAVGYTNVSAAASAGATPTLGIITISGLTLGSTHTITVVGLTGKVRVVGPGFRNTTVPGDVLTSISHGGISLDDAINLPGARAALGVFLADYAPDLILFEMKEASTYVAGQSTTGSGQTYQQRLVQLFAIIAASSPNADVIGIGSPPVNYSGSGYNYQTDQVVQNAMLAAACTQYGYTYYDTYALFKAGKNSTPAQDYAVLVAKGWQGDGTHVTTDCDAYRAQLMLRDLGFFNLPGVGRPGSVEGVTVNATQSVSIGASIFSRVAKFISEGSEFDLGLVLKRAMNWRDSSNVVFAMFDSRNSANNPSAVPRYTQFGPTFAGLIGAAVDQVSARQGTGGAGMNSLADFRARGFILGTVTANGTGTLTLDLTAGSQFNITLTGNLTNLAITGGTAGQIVQVRFIQDGTGSRTITAKGSFKFPGGAIPTLTSTAGAVDMFTFMLAGGGLTELSRSMNVS